MKTLPKRKYFYPLYCAMRKYLHETEIVFESECYDDVLKYEKIIIQNFKDLGIELYNLTDGGEGVLGYKPTEETRQKLSLSKSGKNHPMYGKHHSEETKQKMREANSGEKSHMWGKKGELSYWYGKHLSDETKQKISIANSGENNYMWGKKHSEETKKKMRENHYDNSGQKSSNAHPIEYYETHTSRRDKFKRTCQRMGWNYDNFEEVESDEIYISPNGKEYKKYYYIYRGEDYKKEIDWSKMKTRPVEYYEYTPTLRSDFKNYCKRNNLCFDDFEEIFSGEYYYFKSGSKIGRYFYKRKEVHNGEDDRNS